MRWSHWNHHEVTFSSLYLFPKPFFFSFPLIPGLISFPWDRWNPWKNPSCKIWVAFARDTCPQLCLEGTPGARPSRSPAHVAGNLGFLGKTHPVFPAAPPTPHLIGFSNTKGKKESWDPSPGLHSGGEKWGKKGGKAAKPSLGKLQRNPHNKCDLSLIHI